MTYKKTGTFNPGGSLEVLKTFIFGADAVYISGKLLDCGPRQEISAVKKWWKELHSPSME